MPKSKRNASAKPEPNSFVGLMGIGRDKIPRAAKFDAADLEAVKKAADLMNLSVAIPHSEDTVRLIQILAPGTLLKNGRATVPRVGGKYEELFAAFISDPKAAEADALKSNTAASTPWDQLEVGNIVIAAEVLPQENGWWRAEIISIARDGRLTVRWLDAPRQKPSTFSPREVALLYPART